MFLPFENKSVKSKKKKFHMKILISVTEFSVSLRFHAQSRPPCCRQHSLANGNCDDEDSALKQECFPVVTGPLILIFSHSPSAEHGSVSPFPDREARP